MRPIKRMEIVIDAADLTRLTRILEGHGVTGYTIIKGVLGRGESGMHNADDLTDVFTNTYVLVACDEDKVLPLVESLRPLLSRYGGICLVSDALWVIHTRCRA